MVEAWIALVGVIVGSFITIAKDTWLSWVERRRSGSYAAIRLTCILEEYAEKCIDLVLDDGTAYGQPAGRTDDGEQYHSTQVQPPAPPDYPDDIEWRSLHEPLMHRVLALPNMARSTDRHIQAAAEHAFPPRYEEAFEARQKGYAHLGIEASEISKELRRRYDIDAKGRTDLNVDWDPEAFLRDRLAELTGTIQP